MENIMYKIYQTFFILLLVSFFVSCNSDIENIGYEPTPPQVDYEALKAYKASDHEIMFGWFGGWNGPGTTMATSLMSLPDSVDMVSNWGQPWPLTDVQMEDLKNVREIKGTKVLACIFTPYLGRYLEPADREERLEYWGWGDTQEERDEAVRKYAKALAEEIIKWGYDGLDIDNEPEFMGEPAHIYESPGRFKIFIETLGEYFGPKSGTDKILAIDGYVTNYVYQDLSPYFNYFILQSYYENTYARYDVRFNTVANYFKETRKELAKKIILTEDFEQYSSSGGRTFLQRDGSYTISTLGMANWQPLDEDKNEVKKGGAGLYHIEYDYRNSNRPYHFTRQMINIMSTSDESLETETEEKE